jgi:predicted transcriptional regulator
MRKRQVIYVNLAAEMARKNIAPNDIKKVLGVSQQSVSNKLTGKSDMSINEAFKIRDTLFPTLLVDYLFDTRPRYDLIDIFNFPQSRNNKDDAKDSTHDPDDCA